MLITTHALAGVFISQQVGHPAWAFFIGLLSHFILDIIPHGDEYIAEWIYKKHFKRRAFLVVFTDFSVLSIFVIFLLFKIELPQLSILLAGVIGAILPDIFDNVIGPPGSYLLSKHFYNKAIQKTNPIKSFIIRLNILHNVFHNPFKKKMTTRAGIVLQLILSIFFIIQILIAA